MRNLLKVFIYLFALLAHSQGCEAGELVSVDGVTCLSVCEKNSTIIE